MKSGVLDVMGYKMMLILRWWDRVLNSGQMGVHPHRRVVGCEPKIERWLERMPPGRPAFRSIKPSIPFKKFGVSKPIYPLFLTLRYPSFSF
jgi:hypothetical protein